jgi:hypothetical protein
MNEYAEKVNCYRGVLLQNDYYKVEGMLYKRVAEKKFKALKLRTNNTGYTHCLAKNKDGKVLTINAKYFDQLTYVDRQRDLCPHCGKCVREEGCTKSSIPIKEEESHTPEKSETLPAVELQSQN